MSSQPPDYTAMSGAQFQRAVGISPEKWAEAFMQCVASHINQDHQAFSDTIANRKAFVADWFRDAMDAAVRAQGQLLNWDKPDENDRDG